MRRVYRKGCRCPSAWAREIRKALPKLDDFLAAAAAFETLGMNSQKRRAGFSAYAPHVLVSKNGKPQFPAIWGKQKEIIAKMSHFKCVYCEGPINAPRAAHVEHFRPKALFPSLAYEWTNYFLGCPGCNGAKSDNWPERGGYVRPDTGDPTRHFLFSDDGTVRAVNRGSAADHMIEDLELNRRWLVYHRKLAIGTMRALLAEAEALWEKGYWKQAGNLAKTLLAVNGAPESAYSVALMQSFSRAWKHASSRGAI